MHAPANVPLKVRWYFKELPALGLTVQCPGRQLTF